MERKVGEIFQYKGKTYRTELAFNGCQGCAFDKGIRCLSKSLAELTRDCKSNKDNISVIFKEVNNMEIKNNQLTIEIPKGMEIDLENSNLAKGIVKFKKKNITYCEVTDALKIGENCESIIINGSNASKLVALSKLMNITKYYNKDWEPDWSNKNEYKYSIIYNRNTYKVDNNWTTISSNIYFKNKEDAQEVIDNPNFRSILDAIYKN